jgi:hypothetical protein
VTEEVAMNDLKKRINILRATSDELSEMVFNNDDDFLERFSHDNSACDVTEVSYYEEGVRFTYLGWMGNHVISSISWESFEDWLIDMEDEDE